MRTKVVAALLIIAAVLFFGSFHVVTSDARAMPEFVPRVTFAWREFFVNEDALTRMAPGVRTAQYPLASAALERHWQAEIQEGRDLANRP
jgi:hypothetical protein